MNRAEPHVKFLIYVAVIILINMAAMTLFFRVDLTENDIYSLSPASRNAVGTLSEPLTINVFFTEDLPAPHNSTQRYLRDLLQEYSLHANEYFNYRFYDVSPREEGMSAEAVENQELAESYGIYPVEIRSLEQDEIKFKKAYMGLVIIHGDLIEKIPAITSTDQIEYGLTTAINTLNNKISRLAGLDEQIGVRLVMSSSLETVAPYMELSELARLPETMRDAVEKLNHTNYGRLAYEYVDPGQDEKLDEVLSRYDLMSLEWPDIPKEGITAGRGAIGLVLSYKDRARTLQLLDVVRLPIIGTRYELIDPESLETVVNESIETLIGINEDLGYLADHGAPSLSGGAMAMNRPQGESLRNLNRHLSETYTIKDIRLSEDDRIGEGLNCLLIAHPTETFSDYELFRIDQALMRGTNLAIFTDSFKEVEQPPQQQFNLNQPGFEPLDTGLERLLSHYGIRIRDAYVLDENCFRQSMPARAGGGKRPVYYAPMIKSENINQSLDFMSRIKGLITLQHSPLELDSERVDAQGAVAHQLFSSSERSWLREGEINLNPMFLQPPQDEREYASYPLAFILEGRFESYFADKPVPIKRTGADEEEAANEEGGKASEEPLPKTEENGEQAAQAASGDQGLSLSEIEAARDFIAAGEPSKIAVIGSSALLKDNLIDPEARGPNATFVLNIIDVLNGRGDIAALRSKTQRFNPLEETEPATKAAVKLFNIAGLPSLVVLTGLLAWWRRRMRRRRIQEMFQS